jgi:superfamily II DNA or RNA helicase
MQLKTPYVFGIDETPAANILRQVVVPISTADGSLAPFAASKVQGWLFQPASGSETILIVPPKTKLAKVPSHLARVIEAEIADRSAAFVDVTKGNWLRHPHLAAGETKNDAEEHKRVLDSWKGAFSYVAEEPDKDVIGLRPPQIGAVHAVHAHWSVGETPATIVMPTGTGKTETMLSILVSAGCERLLVIVPTDALRTQIADKFLTLGVLKAQGASILREGALHPRVCVLRHIPPTVATVESLFSRSHVVVTTSSIAGSCESAVQEAIAGRCSHLFIDEAHHAEAPTWSAFKDRFAGKRVLQFTATPFREDGRPLDGQIIYVYPLKKAQSEGYFKPIRFLKVVEFDPNRADEAIAKKAIEQLRIDLEKGHILMARVETVIRADVVFKIYQRLAPDLEVVQLHTGIKGLRAREEARHKILTKQARIVVCVDMLGEGFDLPELKIAAFHDIRKTLSVTLQLAGRFTRSRPDLGDATFIANTADVSVQDELRKLYTRDPDWNVLLPQLSDAMIGEQKSLQDFLKGFTDFAEEIPLKTVRPALSTVVYQTQCEDWKTDNIRLGIPNVSSCEQVHIGINEKEHTVVVVTARRLPLAWTEVETLFSWQWELYVAFWWSEKKLLFINGSTNAGEFKGLAQILCGNDVSLVKGQDVFRSFHGVTRLRLKSVGLSEQLGRNVSYTSRMGSDVAPVLADAQRRKARKSDLSGSGYEGGETATVGASRKGRIWSHRRDRVQQLVEWCKHVGAKLVDPTIDPDAVLSGTLETKIVKVRPAGMPVCVDWPEEIYRSSETPWSVSIDGTVFHISQVELELVEPTLAGPIRVAIANEQARGEFELEIFPVADTSDFRFTLLGEKAVDIIRGDTQIPAAEFFTENPPRVWLADGASLDGNEHTPLKTVLPPYSKDKLIDGWDWSGIDIRKESQGEVKEPDSVQARVIARLKTCGHHLIFDDDGAGEAADVVAVKIVGSVEAPERLDVEFYHCKYSKKAKAGGRVDDLYVVCGQAQTSIRWMSSGEKRSDLFTHLLRREAQRQHRGASTRIEVGDHALIETLREMSRTTRMTLKVVVVQPGVSKAAITDPQLRLLSVTENYLTETYQLPFAAVIAP